MLSPMVLDRDTPTGKPNVKMLPPEPIGTPVMNYLSLWERLTQNRVEDSLLNPPLSDARNP